MKEKGKIQERIIRVLLNAPDGALTGYRVAKLAGSSYQWTYQVLQGLNSKGLVKGTKVVDYSGVINYWRSVRILPDKRDYMHREPIPLLKKAHMQYALTTYEAENLIQHYLFPSRTDFYVRKDEVGRWHTLLQEEGLVGQGNVRLLLADEHVFYAAREQEGLKIVSLPQLIVDLFEEGGVSAEAAERLLHKVEEDALRSG